MWLKLVISMLSVVILFSLITPTKRASQKALKKDTDASVTIDVSRPGFNIPSNFLGLNYEIPALQDTVFFKSNHTQFRNLLNGLGQGVIRLGGYYVNNHSWSEESRTLNTGAEFITKSDLDSMANFMRQTKWKIILNLNLRNSTPQLNTAEAKYVWLNGRDIIEAFEYGNEPETFWKTDYDSYKQQFLANYNNLKSTVSDAPVCGPASLYPLRFLDKFATDNKDKVSFITTHSYTVGEAGKPHSVYELLDEKFIKKADGFSKVVDSVTSKQKLTYRIDECNNFGDEGGDVADRFPAALWGVDFMFTVAQNHCIGINFQGGGRGFTPILIRKGFAMKSQALYYGMLFFHLASQGKLLPVKTDGTNVKSYAVIQPDKKVAVTVINKNPLVSSTVSIAINKKYTKASMMLLESPTLFSKDSITLAKAGVTADGRWTPAFKSSPKFKNNTLTVTVPKATAALITLSN